MFPRFQFSIQEFFICYFYCQKTAFVCEFQHMRKISAFKENNFFGNPPQLWWIWDFAHMYLTQLGTRMWSPASHILVQYWFFWPPKHCCASRAQWKNTFSLTLNLMISQTVRNECLRFGGHVGIQVSYKILWLEVLKDSPFLVTSPWFQ
jgi:hypothetical protein